MKTLKVRNLLFHRLFVNFMIISYFVCANMSAVIENYNTERLKVTLKIMLMSYLNFAENIPYSF